MFPCGLAFVFDALQYFCCSCFPLLDDVFPSGYVCYPDFFLLIDFLFLITGILLCIYLAFWCNEYVCCSNNYNWIYCTVCQTRFILFLYSAKCVVPNKIKKRYGMIANKRTLHKRPNDTEINYYWLPYGLQHILNSPL